jgi:glycosyltransferase involved in cell wall biosynthesis
MLSDVFFPRLNGVSTSIQTFRADLQALGHRVILVAPEYGAPHARSDASAGASHAIDADPQIVRIPSRPVPRDPEDRLFVWSKLTTYLRTLRPADVDLVHTQTPFMAHYAGVRLARRLGAPLIETYHTYFEHYVHHYVPRLPSALTRYAARRFTVAQCNDVQLVVSPSRQMAEALRAYGVQTPIEILPTGLPPLCFKQGDGVRYRAIQGIAPDRPVALFVGRVAHEKNIDFLIEMLARLRDHVPNVLLVIAGEGPAESHIRALVTARGLDAHVLYQGYMDRHTALLDCYRAADTFVFASRTETQGLVLLEAMAQGTPVVSTAVMGTADVLAGAQGAVVVPEEVEAFAAGVARLLTDRDLRASLGELARQDALRWSSRCMAERLAKLYEQMIEDDLAARPAADRVASVRVAAQGEARST